MTERPPMSKARERLLRAGMVIGALMVVVPFVVAVFGIRGASGGPDGLRGATHREDMKEEVGFALSSASLVALLVPPGVLLGVLCGLSWMTDKRRERGQAH